MFIVLSKIVLLSLIKPLYNLNCLVLRLSIRCLTPLKFYNKNAVTKTNVIKFTL